MTFDDYDWIELYREGQLKKLRLSFLELYLQECKIKDGRGLLKRDKLDLISAHIARGILARSQAASEVHEEDLETDEELHDEDDDVVLDEIGDDENEYETDSNDSEDDESSDVAIYQLGSDNEVSDQEWTINVDEINATRERLRLSVMPMTTALSKWANEFRYNKQPN